MSLFKNLSIKLGLPSLIAFSLFSLIQINEIEAISLGSYRASSTRRIDQKRTVGSGSRSPICQTDWEKDSLTLLIPENEVVHHTVSSNPTFYLYAKQTSSEPLVFNVVDPKSNNGIPLFEREIIVNRLGIKEISVPSNISLENNKLYLWQIGFPCKDRPTSVAKVVKGAIEKVTPTDKLLRELNRTDSSIEKAKVYAINGIWYDALQLARENRDLSFFESLLEEANLELLDN